MVSKQVIQVLIEAEENVSKAAKKAEQAISKLGNVGSKAMSAISNVSGKVQGAFSKLHGYVDKARDKFSQFINSSNRFGQIKNSISNVANSFGQLITNGNSAKTAMEKIKSVADGIQSKFTSLGSKIKSFGSSASSSLRNAFSLSGIKEKLSGLGTSIDNLKKKIKSLANEAKNAGGGGGLGFLKNAASMTAGMIGYDLFNGFMQAGRAAINAESQLKYFGSRLKMSATESTDFSNKLDTLQQSFKKVDMHAVGAAAEEMAVKLQLPKTSLEELTKTTAVMSSAFVKEGRTQEDAILAVSDAMDGQFRRLQEIGISQEMLKNNGWDGDIQNKDSLLKAMNKTLDEMGFTQTAQDITSLDEAYQALTVSGGILLRKILIPLTPVLISIMGVIGGVMDAIGGFVQMLQTAFAGLPEWAQIGIAIAAVAVGVGIAIAAFGGLEAILLSLASAIAPVIAIIGAISWPIVAVVAVIGLLIAAIYEVGKAFGWWNNVNGMLAAIADGLGRMWNAFINHPDVQAVISAISGALQWLGEAITWAGQQVLAFFGITTSGNFDVVRALIEGIGTAWQVMTVPIRTAIGVLQAVWGVLSWLVGSAAAIGQGIYNALKPIVCILLGCSPGIVPALQKVYSVFLSVWNAIVGFISGAVSGVVSALQPIIDILTMIGEFMIGQFMESWNAFVAIITVVWNSVSALIGVFQQFMDGQISLTTALAMVWNIISTMFMTVLNIIIQRVISFGSSLASLALSIAMRFVQGIITWITQLPGKVYNLLLQVYNRIVSAGTRWVTAARTKANQLVTGVINFIRQLPGRAYAQLVAVVSRIVSAGQQWVSNARSKAEELVSNVVNSLSSLPGKVSSALSGVVSAIVSPFKSAYDQLCGVVDNIKSKVSDALSAVASVAAGGEMAAGGEFDLGDTSNEKIAVEVKEHILLDLVNVPAHIDTSALIEMLKDKEVLKALTSNPDFQELDSKVKLEINNRLTRARGV